MKRTLLVVDDISINRVILKRILNDDYSVLEASNGLEALNIMRRDYKTLSAVLLDIGMPVMNGYELLDAVNREPALSVIPIIVTTGSTEDYAEVKALELGAKDYITKPYNAAVILRRIKNTINLRETAATVNAMQRDSLTNLYNRDVFIELARDMISAKAPGYYVLSSFDIDHFKVINDQYGTEVGDIVLKHVSDCFKRFIARVDGICARLGGDDFAILYPSRFIDSDELNEIRREASSPERLDRKLLIRTGRYIVDDINMPVSAIYDRAKLAEESMKGKYDVDARVYDESMRLSLINRQEMTNDMNAALSEGQFVAYFQPQINHSTGAIIGCEALARWMHPTRGFISPADFIPLFEDNGFIYELDKYIWEYVCRVIRGWIDMGIDALPVSVNISRYDLTRSDVVDQILALVNEYQVPISLLKLEVTESAFAGYSDAIIDTVEALIREGFTVEIDDFGSGYSSLNTLKDVPASVLKLDMRFLHSGRNPERGGNILESIVRMARWLGMAVIAEGVETVEQAEFLKTIGCYYVQGYLYAKPMPLSEYESFAYSRLSEHKMVTLQTLENMDNDEFWNPGSMDTLIFNSYVGGACVFEYCEGKIEVLRINDNYVKELNVPNMTSAEAFNINIIDYLDSHNAALLFDNIKKAIDKNEESSCELRIVGLSGASESMYVRLAVRVIARTGYRYLLYGSLFNITELREAERHERVAYEQMRSVMDDTPGGLCRMRVLPDNTAPIIYLNDGFAKFVGMSRDEVFAKFGSNALKGIHEEDVNQVRAAFRDAGRNNGRISVRCRVKKAGGDYIPSMLSGRISVNDAGKIFVNAYYTDISDQIRAEELQRELLDNLPCGASLYRFDGKTITAEHLNKRYRELVARDINDPTKSLVAEAVHPEDRGLMFNEVNAAISEGRDINCIIRLKYADTDEYRPFLTYGRSIKNSDGTYSIYGTFFQMTTDAASMAELLPRILDAVMNSTADLSFAKDKNLKYLCASVPFTRMVGYSNSSEIIGKTDYDLFDKTTADKYVADDRRLMDSGESIIDMLEEIPSIDGLQHFSSTSKYLLRDMQDNIIGLYGVGRDVTEYHTAFERLKLLTETIPGGIASFELTPSGLRYIYFNEGFYNYSGYTRDEYQDLLGNGVLDVVHEDDRHVINEALDDIRLGRTKIINVSYRCRVKNDGYRWMSTRAALSDDQSSRLILNAVQVDITDRKLAEEKLRLSEEQYRLAMKQSGNIIFRYDIENMTVHMSEEAAKLFSTPPTVENVPYAEECVNAVTKETYGNYVSFFEKIRCGDETGTTDFETKSVKGNLWIKANFSTVFSSDGEPVYAIISFEDETEFHNQILERNKLIESERALRILADTDGMTGVFNKAVTETKIRDKINDGCAPCALIIADIDDLKIINDTYGHPNGDKAIMIIADTLESCFAETDIVGRIGGDEFIVFVEGASSGEIEERLSNVTERISANRVEDRPLSISLGAVIVERGFLPFEEMYVRADKALYFAKRSGKHRFAIFATDID